MPNYLGEIAAIGTAITFAVASTAFTLSGRVVGAGVINRTRLLLALLILMVLHFLSLGEIMPFAANPDRWIWLGLSGIVGLALGDESLFKAFMLIGPRISMLIMSISPVFSTILAWIFLNERLAVQELMAIFITVAGIAWVVTEGDSKALSIPKRRYAIGILFALGGALGQAGGLVLARSGLYGEFDPLSANVIRMTAATIFVWIIALVRGGAFDGFRKLSSNPRALQWLTLATIIGPVIGVWLSLIAVQHAAVGIASTLIALTPIFLIPISYMVFQEKPSKRSIVGTLIAFIGTALLFVDITAI